MNRIEELAAYHFDAGDTSIARRNELLHQRGGIEAEGHRSRTGSLRQGFGSIEADDSLAAASDIRLDDHRKAQALSRGRRFFRIVDHARAGIRQSKRVQQGKLQGLRYLITEAARAIDYARTQLFKVLDITRGVVNAIPVTAGVRRGTHAVEEQ